MAPRKVINLVSLIVMVSVNVFTPFSYADVENVTIVDIEQPVVEQSKAPKTPEPETPATPEVQEPDAPVEQPKAEPETGTGTEEKVETPAIEAPETGTGLDEKVETPAIEAPETGTGLDEKVETPAVETTETGTGADEKVETSIDEHGITELSGGNNTEELKDEIEENKNIEQEYQSNEENEIWLNDDLELKKKNTLTTFSQDNPHIVYDEDNGLITVYNLDFTDGVTIKDKNVGASVAGTGEDSYGNYYKWRIDTPVATDTVDPNLYYFINGTDDWVDSTLCEQGYHIPSKTDFEDLINIYQETNQDLLELHNNLKIPFAGYKNSADENLTQVGKNAYLRTSSHEPNKYGPFGDPSEYRNKYVWAYQFIIYPNGNIDYDSRTFRDKGLNIRCFKDDYVHQPKIVTFNLSGGYWTESGTSYTGTRQIIYEPDELGNYNVGSTYWKTPSKVPTGETRWMFDGWYLSNGARWTGYITEDMTVYAHWLPFKDKTITVGSEEIVIMDRNIGATATGAGQGASADTYGYHFQWGNNYGFEPCTTDNCSTFPNGEYTGSTQVESTVWQNYLGDNASTYYSSKWITTNPWDKDGNGTNNKLWGTSDDEVSMQGPCPGGYHIPTFGEWKKFLDASLDQNYAIDTMNLPFAGGRNSSTYDVYRRDSYGLYWSSAPKDSNNSRYIDFDSSIIFWQINNIRSRGHSVRCFKNSPAVLLSGTDFNVKIKKLANPSSSNITYESSNNNITGFVKAESLTTDYATGIISVAGSTPVYAWYNDGIIYYYSDADTIYMNKNSSQMFRNLNALQEFDITNFNTSKVEDMSYLFYNDFGLKKIYTLGIDTSKVKTMSYMFSNCGFTGLNISFWNTSSLEDISKMFYNDYNLKNIYMEGWDLSNVTSFNGIFSMGNPSYAISLYASGWKMPSPNISSLFAGSFEFFDLTNGDFNNVTNISGLFQSKWALKGVKGMDSRKNTNNIQDVSNLFASSTSLTGINMSGVNFSSATNMNSIFQGCTSLKYVDLTNFKTNSATSMSGMFYNCYGLTGLNLSSFDTSKVTDMSNMFYNAYGLKIIYASGSFVGATNSPNMFSGAKNLVGGKGTQYNSGYITGSYAKVDNESQTGYFTDPNHFAIEFKDFSGNKIDTQWISIGGEATELTAPAHTTYTYYLPNKTTSYNFSTKHYAYTGIYVKITCDDQSINENGQCKELLPKTVTYHPNGGAFSGMGVNETTGFTYNYSGLKIVPIYNIQIPNRISENPSQQSGWMFAGWYTKSGENNDWGEEFDPETSTETTVYAKWLPFKDLEVALGDITFTIMDRNLGASGVYNQNYESPNTGSYGYHYQWGNNYGFENIQNTYPSNIGTDLVSNPNHEQNPWGPNNYYYSSKFIQRTSSPNRWDYENNKNLWGGENSINSDIDKQGPCPEGYHVPDNLEWKAIYIALSNVQSTECVGDISNFGTCLASKLKLPFAGYHHYNNAGTYSHGSYGYYWSSSPYPSSEEYAYYLYFYSSSFSLQNYGDRSYGYSVRCFKNSSKLNTLTFKADDETISEYDFRWWEPVTKSYEEIAPEKENASFIGWYEEGENNSFNFSSNTLLKENVILNPKYECNFGYVGGDDGNSCKKIGINYYSDNELYASILPDIETIQTPITGLAHSANLDDNGDYTNIMNGKSKTVGGNTYIYSINAYNSTNSTDYLIYSPDIFIIPTYGEKTINIRVRYGGSPYCTPGTIVVWTGQHLARDSDYNPGNYSKAVININQFPSYGTTNILEQEIQGDGFTIYQNGGCPGYGFYITYSWTGETQNLTYKNIDFTSIGKEITKTGYNFVGWYIDEENEFDSGNVSTTEIINVYAKWNLNRYTIKFDINGGMGEVSDIDATYGEEIILPNVTRDGYTFSGWKDENGKIYTDKIEENESLTTENLAIVTLTAQWEENKSSDSSSSSPNSSSGGGKRITPASTDPISDKIKEKEHNSADEKQDEDKSVDTQENQDTSVPSMDGDSQSEANASEGQNGGENKFFQAVPQYTNEQKEAYSFAKSNGITTTPSIEKAKMNTSLKRIEMAKMLSNYAINILGKEPDTSKGVINFKDVTNKMDKQYDNGVTKAYQLGIMGQNMKNNEFRPNDEVTRAEFVTSLSRLLYSTPEGINKGTKKYYEPHMAKLYNEGIITKTDPSMKEKRGNIMIMLMRSVK